jgi:hypothetical protein
MAVAPGLDRNTKHLAYPPYRQRLRSESVAQGAGDHFGCVNRRITKLRQKRQSADMVLVAVAKDQRVRWRDCGDIG